jgi:hypothetical protein
MANKPTESKQSDPQRVSLLDDPQVIGVAFNRTSRNGNGYLEVNLKRDVAKGERVVMFKAKDWGYVLREGRTNTNFFDSARKQG